MKSPLKVIVMRLFSSELVFITAGLFIHLYFSSLYPDLTFLWSVLSLAVLIACCVYLYITAWRSGEHDRNLVKHNHMTYQPKRGFIAGSISSFLPLLLTVLFAVSKLTFVKAIYVTGIIIVPILTGIGYINGHKLKTLGISIVYKKK